MTTVVMNPVGVPRGGVAPDTAAMRRVEAEALVGARREEVWQLYDDIPGTPRWVPFVEDILYVSGPARAGTVYRERTRLGGLPAT